MKNARILPLWAASIGAAWLLASTLNKTFDSDWATGWGTVTESGTCATGVCRQSTAVGNPANSTECLCDTASSTITMHWEWTGTWETLGVPAGATVSTIQHVDSDTLADLRNCTSVAFLGLELRDSSNTLVSTLWAGRTATVDETVWTAEGSDTAQSVGSLTASNSNIELWWRVTLTVSSGAGSDFCRGYVDNLDLAVEYTPAASGNGQKSRRRLSAVMHPMSRSGF